MDTDRALPIITVIIFLMPVVVFVPALVGESTADSQEETRIMYLNESESVGQYIEVTVTDITTNSAEISIVDTDNGESITHELMENETRTYSFENGDISVTLDAIHTNERVVTVIDYPTEFGLSNEENQVRSYMPYMIILPLSIVILMIFYGIIMGDK